MDLRVIAVVVALGVCAPPMVHAQSREDVRAAKKLFADGKRLYGDARYTEAAEVFTEAYELSRRPELLFNVGQAYRLAGKLRDAEKYLQQYLAEAPNADNADEVVDTIVEIQQQIAAELASVQVETAVPGRGVFVDDEPEPRCSTPCVVTLPPGAHRLTIRGDGAADLVEEITLDPGKTLHLKTKLDPKIEMGQLMVSTDRASTLAVADRTEPLPLQRPLALEAGEYAISVESVRKSKWSGRVSVAPNETTDLFVPMQSLVEARKRGSVRKSLAYGLWGVTLASGAGGVLLGLQARDTFTQLEADVSKQGAVADSLVRQGRTQQVAANLMFATATTAAVTGIVLFVWDQVAD